MDLLQQIGQRIRQKRKERGWSQKKLGGLIGISGGMISAIELGDSRTKLENIVFIASPRALDCGLVWLLTGVNMDTKEITSIFTDEEIEVMMAYRYASKVRKQIIRDMILGVSRAKDRKRHAGKKESKI